MRGGAGAYPHAEIKRRRREFRSKYRWYLVAVGVGVAALVLAVALLFPGWYVPGWAALLFSIALVVVIGGPQIDGTYHLISGRDAERWTSNDLRRVLGSGWHVVDGIYFLGRGDTDHVAVGPSGVYVVETKTTDSVLDLSRRRDRARAAEWADELRRRSRSFRLWLRKQGVLVVPVIIIWGDQVRGTPTLLDDVRIIHRRDLYTEIGRWKEREGLMTTQDVDVVAAKLRAYRDKQIAVDKTDRAVPTKP